MTMAPRERSRVAVARPMPEEPPLGCVRMRFESRWWGWYTGHENDFAFDGL
jgi:hypothetical protein